MNARELTDVVAEILVRLEALEDQADEPAPEVTEPDEATLRNLGWLRVAARDPAVNARLVFVGIVDVLEAMAGARRP